MSKSPAEDFREKKRKSPVSKSESNGSGPQSASREASAPRRIGGELAEDGGRAFRAVGGSPAFPEKRRAVDGDVRAVDGIVADISAEDGVHESAAACPAELFGGVDGDIHGGLPWEPGLEKDLGGRKRDQEPHLLVDFSFPGVLDEQGIQEILVSEILEKEGCDGGFRREILGPEVIQAVVEGNAVIFPCGQGGERVFQDTLGNAGCLQR